MTMDQNLFSFPFCHLNDEEFNLAIFEMNQGRINFDADRLESLYFNPLNVSNSTSQTIDIDPDHQFFSYTGSSYYVSDQFNDLCTKFNSSLSLLHLNARSLNHNLPKLTDFLNTLDLSFSVIGVTKTWLQNNGENTSNNDIHIQGYNFIHNCRQDKTGGGVGFFIDNNFEYKQLHDLEFFDHKVFESIFIEIERSKQRNVILGIIYRAPDANLSEFFSKLNELLSNVAKEQKPCYLLGDYNIDLVKYQQHFHTNNYLDNLFSHCFLPLINRPTRITTHSASLIDNIFTNHLASDSKSGILFTDISDHLPIFTLLCQTEGNISSSNIILNRRLVNAKTQTNFRNQLMNFNWDSVYKTEDPEKAYKIFVDAYIEMHNNCFPIRRISRNQAKLYSKPWITKGLLKSIKTKCNLYNLQKIQK